MHFATFKGGIHPYEGKELSKEPPVVELKPGKELVFPLSQHIGAPAKATVAVGDRVKMGQEIGAPEGFISAPVIASVSGVVTAIEPRRVANGTMQLSIVLENDDAYEPVEGFGRETDWEKLSKEEIRGKIKEAGIVGMGGAGFPTWVKLTPKEDDAIEYVIVNGAECEPYLTSDYRMLLEETQSVILGLKIELSLFPNAQGVIGIEENKPDAIAKMQEAVKGEPRITVCPLKTKYPQGGERTLIYAITGRKINSTMLPSDVGCIVSNTDTAISIAMAVAHSIPLIRRIITVTGDAVKHPGNFNVKTGTMYRELLEAAGGFSQEPEKIISGGPMMGQALFSLDIPVAKTSSALLCLTKDQVAQLAPSACIRCGRCVEVCPGRIVPQMAAQALEKHNLDLFVKYDGMECCECGCCSYICPARRNLTQMFKEARKEVMALRKKKAQEAKKVG